MNILSIQSHVAYGHAGNAAAVFPMQRLGHEVWPVNTVQFSNHTGYGAWKGEVFKAALIDDCVEGIAERGALARCNGVLTGYMGGLDTGEAILRSVAKVRAANPDAVYCCDPVIGDVGRGTFVRPGIPEFFKTRLLPHADIVTPNQFELDFLAGGASDTVEAARASIARIHALGPRIVMVTSLVTAVTPPDAIDIAASDGTNLWCLRTPRLDIAVNGAGDAIAALFFVHWLETRSAAEALARAGSSIYGLLRRTAAAGSPEILTIAAQEEFVLPSRRFEAERM